MGSLRKKVCSLRNFPNHGVWRIVFVDNYWLFHYFLGMLYGKVNELLKKKGSEKECRADFIRKKLKKQNSDMVA